MPARPRCFGACFKTWAESGAPAVLVVVNGNATTRAGKSSTSRPKRCWRNLQTNTYGGAPHSR